MGEQDPDFRDPAAEAAWIARAIRGQVVMVPEAGHYPQSQRPGITSGAVLHFLATVPARPGWPAAITGRQARADRGPRAAQPKARVPSGWRW